ncbi:autotransporter domain-containing protein [Tardiphaga sp. 42S5]|uniref:autotransporter domain-containing protein n=1 Tax=Tardiphaga sp. 42S5 TaxID=1404799 RepID=UPI002A59EFC3|nr:autotransporter domain-containing protein [Tardiphaga sp. 42S5]WPO44333.1 autotransporter domain-containing protein [Tardiphaga sp. 42S5]
MSKDCFGAIRRLRAALLTSSALVMVLGPLATGPARAQDATWLANPGSADFYTGSNWSPNSVPTGTATFDTSATTALTLGTAGSIGGWTFNAGASAYTFDVTADQTFTGAGIVINGGSATINFNSGTNSFQGSSTAGNATITNNAGSTIEFRNSSTAGYATITNAGTVTFIDSSTAGNAQLINNGTGAVFDFSGSTGPNSDNKLSAGSIAGNGTFALGANELTVGVNDLSTEVRGVIAGTGGSLVKTGDGTLTLSGTNTYTGGTIINGGTLQLGSTSRVGTILGTVTVDGATIFDVVNADTSGITSISNSGNTYFRNSTSAGSATITNNGSLLLFQDTSTAGSATINNSGLLYFSGSTAGSANITNNLSLSFFSTSAAGSAVITNSGALSLYDTSTAGSAIITNNVGGEVTFNNATTAGDATITNNNGGFLKFYDTSTAGSANITNNYGLDFYSTSTAGSAIITNNRGIGFYDASSAGSATISNSGALGFAGTGTAGNANITNNNNLVFGGTSTAGSATITNSGTLGFNNASTGGSATITNNGTLQFFDSSTGGAARLINGAGGTIDASTLSAAGMAAGSIEGAGTIALGSKGLQVGGNNLSTTFSGVLQDGGLFGGTGGSLIKTGTGTLTLSGINAYTGGTTFAGGAVSVSFDANLGDAAGGLTFNGGVLQVMGTTFSSTARTITWGADGGTFDIANAANNFTVGQTLNGGQLTKSGAGTLTLAAANTFTGGLTMNSGTLNLGAMTQTTGALTLAGGMIANGTLTGSAFNTQSGTISAVLAGSGAVTQSGAGTTILSGINTYTGATTVNGGTLSVNGSILTSSGVTVNSGGTLGGNGIVGNTTINGGTLAPGNSIGLLTVQGNLVLTAASSYMIEVSPANADRVNVTGTANLGGATVNASFAAGTYVARQYTVLNATGGLGGSTFGSVVNTNLPSGFKTSLSYDANNAYLDLKLDFVPPPDTGLGGNQSGVGNALVSYFNRNGGIPLVYGGLTATGLTQASGETATGGQQTAFNAMTQFMGSMTDTFAAGRGGAAPGAIGFADTNADGSTAKSRAARDAYAMFTKAPLAQGYDPRWSVWASGFGGSQTTDGNSAAGSNTSTSRIYGAAVGADYLISPNTVAGFAMAGGGTSFSVTGGGSGRSDLFQIGGFVRHTIGSTYLSGALAYGWQDVTTNRTVMTDQLQARFNASTFSGRFEAGNRTVTSWFGGLGLTPYAAAQVTAIALPAYAETALSGSNAFALSYAGKTVTDTRSELGLRTDKSFAVNDAILTLRGRAAWAHDFNTDRAASATFIALPGASFVVNGAAAAHDSALTTASAEIAFTSGISLAATFEGEFSQVTRSYAGKGVARYSW